MAADLPGSKDPPGMKRYEGSEIIGYRAAKFDEFVLPLGPPKQIAPPAYEKSLAVDGLISRYTYIAPAGRSPTELFRNYKLEFQRLGLVTLYEKGANERGWFGPTLVKLQTRIDWARSPPTTKARSGCWWPSPRTPRPLTITFL